LAAINAQLRQLDEQAAEVHILGATGQAGLASGIAQGIKVSVTGQVGAFFGLLNAGGDLELNGDCGAGCGHSMSAGGILVRGQAGHALAAFARGGFIGVHGSAKDACALALAGADIVVRQSVGARAAERMQSGHLVLGSDAGAELGKDAIGGTIYLRGTAASVSDQLQEVRMRESDAMRLGLLLVRAGIKGNAKDFRVYRPRVKSEA
jgi:glutamate synthase domain-containing protein 3